jgi:uncharacterized protein YecE (DUF72 family)
MTVRIGISGWRYAPWRGDFYPKGLRQKDELAFAARHFGAIEINGTFYSLQRPKLFQDWAAAVPADLVFAVKGPRFITHLRRLKQVEVPMANFWASGVLALGPKLGPILWQFPPNFRFDPGRLEPWLAMLPHDTEAALQAARGHDHRLDGRDWLQIDRKRPLRHAIEIRHDSFRSPDFIALLRRHKVALVCADTVEWPRLMDVTADFLYLRLHGSEELYASGYGAAALDDWARRVVAWAGGGEPPDGEKVVPRPAPKRARRDVFVFFDNDIKVRAPYDAQGLIERVAGRRPALPRAAA